MDSRVLAGRKCAKVLAFDNSGHLRLSFDLVNNLSNRRHSNIKFATLARFPRSVPQFYFTGIQRKSARNFYFAFVPSLVPSENVSSKIVWLFFLTLKFPVEGRR